ncbi:hypothetical protein SK128_016135 [Halocaridina rubra]|uniref:Uncharacterized protein n=1 Tax=Halocaridina rubra TaxID=373956 RepID=A0AAN8XBC5_HALRR
MCVDKNISFSGVSPTTSAPARSLMKALADLADKLAELDRAAQAAGRKRRSLEDEEEHRLEKRQTGTISITVITEIKDIKAGAALEASAKTIIKSTAKSTLFLLGDLRTETSAQEKALELAAKASATVAIKSALSSVTSLLADITIGTLTGGGDGVAVAIIVKIQKIIVTITKSGLGAMTAATASTLEALTAELQTVVTSESSTALTETEIASVAAVAEEVQSAEAAVTSIEAKTEAKKESKAQSLLMVSLSQAMTTVATSITVIETAITRQTQSTVAAETKSEKLEEIKEEYEEKEEEVAVVETAEKLVTLTKSVQSTVKMLTSRVDETQEASGSETSLEESMTVLIELMKVIVSKSEEISEEQISELEVTAAAFYEKVSQVTYVTTITSLKQLIVVTTKAVEVTKAEETLLKSALESEQKLEILDNGLTFLEELTSFVEGIISAGSQETYSDITVDEATDDIKGLSELVTISQTLQESISEEITKEEETSSQKSSSVLLEETLTLVSIAKETLLEIQVEALEALFLKYESGEETTVISNLEEAITEIAFVEEIVTLEVTKVEKSESRVVLFESVEQQISEIGSLFEDLTASAPADFPDENKEQSVLIDQIVTFFASIQEESYAITEDDLTLLQGYKKELQIIVNSVSETMVYGGGYEYTLEEAVAESKSASSSVSESVTAEKESEKITASLSTFSSVSMFIEQIIIISMSADAVSDDDIISIQEVYFAAVSKIYELEEGQGIGNLLEAQSVTVMALETAEERLSGLSDSSSSEENAAAIAEFETVVIEIKKQVDDMIISISSFPETDSSSEITSITTTMQKVISSSFSELTVEELQEVKDTLTTISDSKSIGVKSLLQFSTIVEKSVSAVETEKESISLLKESRERMNVLTSFTEQAYMTQQTLQREQQSVFASATKKAVQETFTSFETAASESTSSEELEEVEEVQG